MKRPGSKPWVLRDRHHQPPQTVCPTHQGKFPWYDYQPHFLTNPPHRHQTLTTQHQGGSLGSVSPQWYAMTSPFQAAILINRMIPPDPISTKRWYDRTYPSTDTSYGRMPRRCRQLSTGSTRNSPGWPINIVPARLERNEYQTTRHKTTSQIDGSTPHQSQAHSYLHIPQLNTVWHQLLLIQTFSLWQTNPCQCPPPTGMPTFNPPIQMTTQRSSKWSVVIRL